MTLQGALPIDHWETPASKYPLATFGTARLTRSPLEPGFYPYWGIDNYIYIQVRQPILITSLELFDGRDWKTWMVDDPPQYRSMQIYADAAHGKVLVGGLGLGLVCHELVKNPLVDEIWVVERNPDVISLVRGHLPAEVRIAHDDFVSYAAAQGRQWDSIIVDLWVTGSAEEKVTAYTREVAPLNQAIRERHPNATVMYHGFHTVSDVQVASDAIIDQILRLRPYGQRQ